jgi:ribosomal protein S18 acetylase RimI-like enzyme
MVPVSLTELAEDQVGPLLAASEAEGFRSVRRVVDEWTSGANRFSMNGEALLGCFLNGHLVAICGLTRDPYQSQATVGRLRNLYVLPEYRGREIGAALVRRVVELAGSSFEVLRLRAANPQAAALYERLGFRATTELEHCTHVMRFHSRGPGDADSLPSRGAA